MTPQRLWVLGLVFLGCVFAAPGESSAFIGWIEPMSGPGRFWGVQVPLDRILCVVTTDTGKSAVHPLSPGDAAAAIACDTDDTTRVKAFVSLEFVAAKSWNNRLHEQAESLDHNQVTLLGFRPVVFYRPWPFLDVGVGIGWTRFSGDDFPTFTRASIPLRVRVIPAGFRTSSASPWRAIYLHVGWDLFPEEFTDDDFGAQPEQPWSEDLEFLRSVFLGLDVLKLRIGRR
jgi:hypothetical protein